jgi:mannose-6-phosphate isomerase-like protein (cupin superfamily)
MSQPATPSSPAPDNNSGHLPGLAMADRPSGAKLGIYELPSKPAPVAPFTLAKIHVPVGVTTTEDHHEVREIWLVQSGTGRLYLDGEELRISAGDSLFYDSFHRHQLNNDGTEPINIISIWWQP